MITHKTYDTKLSDFQALVLAQIKDNPRYTAYDHALASNGNDEEVYQAIGFLLAHQRVKQDKVTGVLSVWGM